MNAPSIPIAENTETSASDGQDLLASIEQRTIRQGAIIINNVRYFLASVFAGSILASVDFTNLQVHRIALMTATLLYFAIAIASSVYFRRRENVGRFSRITVLLDTATIVIAYCVMAGSNQERAYWVTHQPLLFTVWLLVIAYSVLTISRLFTMVVTGLFAIGYVLVNLSAMGTGLLADELGGPSGPTRYSLVDEGVKIVFLIAFGIVGNFTLKILHYLQAGTRDAALQSRRLLEELQEERGTLANAAGTLDTNLNAFRSFIDDTNQRLESQASAVEQATSVMEELHSSSNQISENVTSQSITIQSMTEQSDQLRQLIREIAESSRALVEKSEESQASMEEVLGAVEESALSLQQIKQAFANVNEITGIMSEIADKTNLLALNAAIEAARAGDAGRGFAVVADEVGKLADYTGQNTRKIRGIVDEALRDIDGANNRAARTRNLVDDQARQVQESGAKINATGLLYEKQQTILTNLLDALQNIREIADEVQTSTQEQNTGQAELKNTMSNIENEVAGINTAARSVHDRVTGLQMQASELLEISQRKH